MFSQGFLIHGLYAVPVVRRGLPGLAAGRRHFIVSNSDIRDHRTITHQPSSLPGGAQLFFL